MRLRCFVAMSALVGAVLLSDLAAPARGAETSARQRATVLFKEPVVVAGTFLMGRIVIVHDQDRKDRGEPCTQFLQLAEGQPPVEIVSIHCKRVSRPVADQLTLGVRKPDINYRILTSYQFRGSDHAHELLPDGHSPH